MLLSISNCATTHWYLFFDHLQDMVLLADMLIMFCTAYVNKKSVLTYDMRQGLTLVHISAQLERFLWDRGCM